MPSLRCEDGEAAPALGLGRGLGRGWLGRCLAGGLLLAALAAAGREAPPLATDPALEQRMMNLASELRCLVCQNQTLADSQADLAADLRQQIREQIQAGRSDEQIKQYLVARYGDYVLYRPPLSDKTLFLWFGPAALLLAGLAAMLLAIRRRQARLDAERDAEGLSEAERRRARALLGDTEPDEGLS